MIARSIILQPEQSIDVSPGVVTLYDLSRYRNNGTMTNVTWVQLPSGLWVQSFNGTTSLVDFGNTASVRIRRAFSYSAWFYANTIVGADHLICKWGGDANRSYRSVLINGMIYFVLFDNSGGVRQIGRYYNTVLNTSQWYYTVGTWDGTLASTGLRIYLNGVRVDDTNNNAGVFTGLGDSTVPLRLGCDSDAAAEIFDGYLVLDKFDTYTWTPGQVRNRYENTKHWFGIHD